MSLLVEGNGRRLLSPHFLSSIPLNIPLFPTFDPWGHLSLHFFIPSPANFIGISIVLHQMELTKIDKGAVSSLLHAVKI